MKQVFFLLIATIYLTGCGNNQQSTGHSHGPGGTHPEHEADAGATIQTLSYTLFNEGLELFVEFPAPAVDQISTFATHFTWLNTYKPVSEGKLTVSIIKEGKGIRHSVDGPSSPGIFRPALQPKEAGIYTLVFELEFKGEKSRFEFMYPISI